MKSSHSIQPFVPNKKLIVHFDVDNVLRINHPNRDLFVLFFLIKGVWTLRKMGLGKVGKNCQRWPREGDRMENCSEYIVSWATLARFDHLHWVSW